MDRIGHAPINSDHIGYVDLYDFSAANLSEESRIDAVTTVASICYNSNNKIGSKVLYDKLAGESIGLPSSSFEFVPMLLNTTTLDRLNTIANTVNLDSYEILDIERFGELITDNGNTYLLTNLRAWLSTIDMLSARANTDKQQELIKSLVYLYNTEDDARIISKHYYVFRYKVDLNTRSQMVRHRMASWQELSRRYVSGNKLAFEFYKKPSMNSIGTDCHLSGAGVCDVFVTPNDLYTESVNLYNAAVKIVPAQDARRLIPQAMYTEIWGAWMPRGLNNFIKLRLDSHAQNEIREVAEAMDWYIKKDII